MCLCILAIWDTFYLENIEGVILTKNSRYLSNMSIRFLSLHSLSPYAVLTVGNQTAELGPENSKSDSLASTCSRNGMLIEHSSSTEI
mmetsp:Transcript_17272/g.25733  ORF Transcript_17272/g.25733 Transcript_17272/m.25733 type:complete len:87 (-) Transcript_17272:2207-2467(-)